MAHCQNGCYSCLHTHGHLRGCSLCVHTLPWLHICVRLFPSPRKCGPLAGTWPKQLLLMFTYKWTHARLPTMCPYFALVPNVWTHRWRLGGVLEFLGTVLKRLGGCIERERERDIGFASTYRCVDRVGLRCVCLPSRVKV